MTKIICFEGVHGSGKSTLIQFLLKSLDKNFSGKVAVIRDSMYPEFKLVKKMILAGDLSEKKSIISVVSKTREKIYKKYITKIIQAVDLVILDRSYYTSAVWHAETHSEIDIIIHEHEKRDIPRADIVFILHAPIDTITRRLGQRNRTDLEKNHIITLKANQDKYLYIAGHCPECRALCTLEAPEVLVEKVYNYIFPKK